MNHEAVIISGDAALTHFIAADINTTDPNCQIVVFHHPTEALRTLQKAAITDQLPPPDIIILDHQGNQVDRYSLQILQVLGHMNAIAGGIIHLVNNHVVRSDEELGKLRDFSDTTQLESEIITKPIQPDTLIRPITRLLRLDRQTLETDTLKDSAPSVTLTPIQRLIKWFRPTKNTQ